MVFDLDIPEAPWWETLEVITDKHPKQKEIFDDPSQFKVVSAGRGFGKSILLIESCIYASLLTKVRDAKAWIVAPNDEAVRDIYWYDLINRLKYLHRITNKEVFLYASEKKKKIYVRNASGGHTEISLKSAEAPNTLIGVSLIFLGIDEMWKISRKIWTQHLEPTLRRGLKGELFVISTPNGHDYFHELWQFGSKQSPRYNKKWKSWQCKTTDNPLYPVEYIEEARLTMAPWEFEQQYNASFDTATGRVYIRYNFNDNVRKNIPLEHNLPLNLTFDFNVSPMTCSVAQVRPGNPEYISIRNKRDEIIKQIKDNRKKLKAENKLDGLQQELTLLKSKIITIKDKEQDEVVYFLKCFKENNINVEMFCELIVSWLKKESWTNKILIYGDSNGGSRNVTSDKTAWQIIRNAFSDFETYHEYPAKNPDPMDRINAVNRLLRNSDGEIGIYIDEDNCKPIIEDLNQVDFKEGTNEINKTKLERMGLNHTIEGVGYFVHRRFPIVHKNSFQFAWI